MAFDPRQRPHSSLKVFGKEKPLTCSRCSALISGKEESALALMLGHPFVYAFCVECLKPYEINKE